MDARRALLALRRWWPVVVVGTLLAAGVAYAVSKALPKVYEATAMLQVNPGIGTVGGGVDFNEEQAAWYVAADDARLIATSPIAQPAIDQVRGRLSALSRTIDAGTLLNDTKAQAAPQSRIVSLAVRAGDPNDARLLANAMATIFVARDAQARAVGLPSSQAEINRQINVYSADHARALQQLNRLALLGARQTPAQRAESSALSERIATDQNMLWYLTQETMGIGLWRAGAGLSVSVAQPAGTPSAPISPRTAVNTLVAAVLAFVVLLGAVLLLEYLDGRPRSPADVAARLELPLLGTVSRAPRGGAALVALEDPAAAAADEYRALRANLNHATDLGAPAHAGTPPVLVVTGVRPGDGATTVAANLAALAARAGERVVLVDGNLRRPGLHALFGLPEGIGLAGLLRDAADPLPLLHETGLAGLRVLVAGHASAEGIDLLGSGRMRDVVAALRTASDLVVIDAATATSPDAATLSALAGHTLIVVRLAGATAESLVRAARQLRLAGARLAGVAVTLAGADVAPGPAAHRAAAAVATIEPAGRAGLRGANK